MHICILHTYLCISTYTFVYMYIQIYICICTYTHIYVHKYMYTSMYTNICMYTYSYIHIHMHMYTHVFPYTHCNRSRGVNNMYNRLWNSILSRNSALHSVSVHTMCCVHTMCTHAKCTHTQDGILRRQWHQSVDQPLRKLSGQRLRCGSQRVDANVSF